MVDKNRYIGVEQEFITFKKDNSTRSTSFIPYFHDVLKSEGKYLAKSSTAIRTTSGHAVYIDQNELEVCTPPVRLNKGFATRLTDLVMIGRDKLVNAVPDVNHTGFSMHWNLSRGRFSPRDFMEGLALPFNLFGLTPLSSGFNMRVKNDEQSGNRAEFLGDFISYEDQINALALIMGAYSYAFDATRKNYSNLPIRTTASDNSFDSNTHSRVLTPNGRFSTVYTAYDQRMSAQLNLEMFYQWIRPFAEQLGTKQEVDNLEGFVFGKKKLEFDQFKYFAFMKGTAQKVNGTYLPMALEDLSMPDKKLVKRAESREVPLEGKLLGGIISSDKKKIKDMFWGQLILSGNKLIKIDGIHNIYKYGAYLDKSLPTLENSPELDLPIDFESIRGVKAVGPISYDKEQDSFVFPERIVSVEEQYKKQSIVVEAAKMLRDEGLTKGGLQAALISLGVAAGLGYLLSGGIHRSVVNSHAERIFSSPNSMNIVYPHNPTNSHPQSEEVIVTKSNHPSNNGSYKK